MATQGWKAAFLMAWMRGRKIRASSTTERAEKCIVQGAQIGLKDASALPGGDSRSNATGELGKVGRKKGGASNQEAKSYRL